MAVVTLLTDFGLQDTYVAQMRGVIAGLAPGTTVIDLTHAIEPQNRLQGAIALADAVEAFPDGTLHVVVIDPGVGSERRAIAAEIGRWRFVAPDNGVLTGVLEAWALRRAVSLTNPQFFRASVSRTFHGRDLFASVAAHWTIGVSLDLLGVELTDPLVRIPWPRPAVTEREIAGEVLVIDRFGNLMTNITADLLPTAEALQVTIGAHDIGPVVGCYAERPNELLALIGSNGRLEVAVGLGSAARQLKLGVGAPVTVRW